MLEIFYPRGVTPAPAEESGFGGPWHVLYAFLEEELAKIEAAIQQIADQLESEFLEGEQLFPVGESMQVGDVCYLASDGNMYKAGATTLPPSSGLLGVVLSNAGPTGSAYFTLRGEVSTSGLTTGSVYYLSETPGEYTIELPSAGSYTRIVGYARNAGTLVFMPDRTWIEVGNA